MMEFENDYSTTPQETTDPARIINGGQDDSKKFLFEDQGCQLVPKHHPWNGMLTVGRKHIFEIESGGHHLSK